MLAGAYVGFGIILIFVDWRAAGRRRLTGGEGRHGRASFGVALSLVIFAGSELFTGNNMVMTMAA